MSRPDLSRELDAITRHLVLLAALVESLSRSVRTPQDGPGRRPGLDPRPGGARGATGKGSAIAPRCTRAPGDLPGSAKRTPDA